MLTITPQPNVLMLEILDFIYQSFIFRVEMNDYLFVLALFFCFLVDPDLELRKFTIELFFLLFVRLNQIVVFLIQIVVSLLKTFLLVLLQIREFFKFC